MDALERRYSMAAAIGIEDIFASVAKELDALRETGRKTQRFERTARVPAGAANACQ